MLGKMVEMRARNLDLKVPLLVHLRAQNPDLMVLLLEQQVESLHLIFYLIDPNLLKLEYNLL